MFGQHLLLILIIRISIVTLIIEKRLLYLSVNIEGMFITNEELVFL